MSRGDGGRRGVGGGGPCVRPFIRTRAREGRGNGVNQLGFEVVTRLVDHRPLTSQTSEVFLKPLTADTYNLFTFKLPPKNKQ